MGKDQAAAILGDAHDAYFDIPCEACKGAGELVPDVMRPDDTVTCPNCDGSGETKMPDASQILKAARTLTLVAP